MKDRKWFLEKFDSGEKFSEDELQDIAYGDVGLKSVERSYGENRRWTRTVTGVYEADGRLPELQEAYSQGKAGHLRLRKREAHHLDARGARQL